MGGASGRVVRSMPPSLRPRHGGKLPGRRFPAGGVARFPGVSPVLSPLLLRLPGFLGWSLHYLLVGRLALVADFRSGCTVTGSRQPGSCFSGFSGHPLLLAICETSMVSSPSIAWALLEVSLWRARFPVAASARAPSFAFSRCGVLGVGCPGDSASLLALESLILEQQEKK